MGWLFHARLALVFIGHLRVISWLPDRFLGALGMDDASIGSMSAITGGGAGIVMLLTALFIVLRRFFVPRVREISAMGDYFAIDENSKITAMSNVKDKAKRSHYFHAMFNALIFYNFHIIMIFLNGPQCDFFLWCISSHYN